MEGGSMLVLNEFQKVLWWILQQRLSILLCWQQMRRVFWVKEFFIELGEFPRMRVLLSSIFIIVVTLVRAEELRSHQLTKYIQIHLIGEWMMRIDADTNRPEASDLLINLFHEQNMINTKSTWVLDCYKCKLDYWL